MPNSSELLAKINEAVAARNEAETKAETAKAELISRSKTVGLLLLEAKKLHPTVKDFEAFLKKVQGLKLSRAYDCMSIAGGRKTDEEIKEATRERTRKSRAKRKKLARATPPAPEPQLSATVAESALPRPTPPAPEPQRLSATVAESAEERAANASARGLAQFTTACRIWLPRITVEAHRCKARILVTELTTKKPKAEAA